MSSLSRLMAILTLCTLFPIVLHYHGFLSRLVVVMVPWAALAASAMFCRRHKLLRVMLKTSAQAAQASQLNASVYELYRPPGQASVEILFFHGFQHGDYKDAHLSAWKCGDGSSIWPQTWLVEKFPDARILSVSYGARVIKGCDGGTIDMHIISENLTSDLLSANIGQEPGRPVVLVGHSFGGLVIKHICVYASSKTGRLKRNSEKNSQLTAFLENIKGMFFYSTPHQGVLDHIAKHFLAEGPLLEYVKILSTPNARVSFDFANLCGQDGQYKMWKIAGLGESVRTKSGSFNDIVVEEGSARYGSSFHIVEASDHMSVCRPMEKKSRSFSALTIFLEGFAADSKAMVYGLPDYPTALETRVFKVQQKLKTTPVLGIVGMGGIGKTTIAKQLFNNLARQFEYTCFVDNVKGMKERELNDWLLNHFLRNGTRRKSLQWSHLEKKKILIGLDDVDSESQLRILPGLEEFASGSRLIFTTREKGVLNTFPNCGIYEVDFLKPDEAQKLFCQHAFQQEGIPDDLTDVCRHLEANVKKVVEKCGGLPLTLEVLGCYLRDHKCDSRVWEETINKLGKAQSVNGLRNDRVWSSLRVSYDALSPAEQGMFIEAGTLFFGRPVEIAVAAWSTAFGYSESRWANLLSTSMVKEVDVLDRNVVWRTVTKKVWVHEQLRDLAKDLSKGAIMSRSVGSGYTAVDLLNANTVQAQTSILQLWDGDDNGKQNLPLELLDKLEKLKYLELVGIHLKGSCTTLSRKLCLLKCIGSIVRDHPFPISLEEMNNLAILELVRWQMPEESVEALAKLSNLRFLLLRDIRGISCLPNNFGHLYQLKRLELTQLNLRALPHSFGSLSALEHLLLDEMEQLVELPESFGNLLSLTALSIYDCQMLATLPDSIGQLKSLKRLTIIGAKHLGALPGTFGNLRALTHLRLHDCHSLRGLPASFGNLSALQELRLLSCDRLQRLPDHFGQLRALENLSIERAEELERLSDDFGNLPALSYLELSGCPSLQRLPESFGLLSALQELSLVECTRLRRLPDNFCQLTGLKRLKIHGAYSLEDLPDGLGSLSSLSDLWITAGTLQRLPVSIGQLQALKRLTVLGDMLRSLPEELGYLSSLESLRIGCGRLETVPDSLGRISSLRVVMLHSCWQLTSLPDGFGKKFSHRGDRSAKTKRPAEENSCRTASTEGLRLQIFDWPLLDHWVLQRLLE